MKHNTSHTPEIQKILGFQKCRLIGNLTYDSGMDDTGAIGQLLPRLIRRMDCLNNLLPQREVGTNKNVEVLSFLQHGFLLYKIPVWAHSHGAEVGTQTRIQRF